jgi:hypothetical protein
MDFTCNLDRTSLKVWLAALYEHVTGKKGLGPL